MIGNKLVLSAIDKTVSEKTFGNAFLFVGPAGSGRHLLANRFIKSVLCEKNNGCGECRSCRLVDKGIHPDVLYFSAADGKKSISVDEARNIRNEAFIKPIEADYKFIVINDADGMNVQAQNALLLSLEEPPEHTVFILIASGKNGILPTVLSRCTVFPTERISPSEIAKLLISDGTDAETANKAARLSGGVIGKAREIAANPDDESSVSELLRCFAMKNPFGGYEKFCSLSLDSRDGIIKAATELCEAARDLAVYSSTGDIKTTVFIGDEELIKKASSFLGKEGLCKLASVADDIANAAEANCNAKLLAATLFIKGWECFNG